MADQEHLSRLVHRLYFIGRNAAPAAGVIRRNHQASGKPYTVNIQRVSSWLQIAANLAILGGLVLVLFQLEQNSDILQAQMMSAESRSVVDQEMQIIGEQGAAAWVSAMSDPVNVSPEHHRVMESILWSAVESWRHIERLEKLGLADVDPRNRVREEAAWYFGNIYGRAWWTTRKESSGLSDELKDVVDQAIRDEPNLTGEIHDRLTREILRLESEH